MPYERQQITELIGALAHELAVDRCWVYARDPGAREGIALVRWLRAPGVRDVPEDIRVWSGEDVDLAARDPLFARALAGVALDCVADAGDSPLERALGHRAFIHGNLHVDGRLWGTVQPGMTGAPRVWTARDRDAVLRVRGLLAPLVAGLARARAPSALVVAGELGE